MRPKSWTSPTGGSLFYEVYERIQIGMCKKTQSRERIDDPGGYKRHTFMDSVRRWAKIFDALGKSA